MPILVILIISSLSFYLYFKIKYIRSNRPMEKKWISSKSKIALGSFVLTFGVNRIYISQTPISIIISTIFIIIGFTSIWTGVRAYKYYLPYTLKEAQENNFN